MKDYLTKEQLENIKNHKYIPCEYSSLDKVLNKLVWIPVSNAIPAVILF